MRPRIAPTGFAKSCLLFALALMASLQDAQAHGGGFRGPNLPPPTPSTPGSGAAAKGGPAASGGGFWRNSDPAAWSQWWALDRDLYLRQAKALQVTRNPVTGPRRKADVAPDTDAWKASLRQHAIPELIRIVRKEKDVDMLTSAVMALAKVGLEPAATNGKAPDMSTRAAIESLLSHGNQEVAESALLALGILGQRDAAPRLAEILQGQPKSMGGRGKINQRKRALAAYALAAIGRRSPAAAVRSFCVYHLAGQLQGSKDLGLDLGVACVIGVGLIPLERSDNRGQGAPLTKRPGTSREGQVDLLFDLLTERRVDDKILAYLPVALARLSGDVDPLRERLIDDLVQRLAPRSKEAAAVRVGCVHALGLVVDRDQTPLSRTARARLMEIARGGDRLERVLAMASLGRIGGRGMDPLGETAGRLRSFLMERMSKGQTYETPWAALGVGLLEHSRRLAGEAPALGTLAALRSALASAASPDDVGSLCIALALAGDQEAIPLVLERAQGGDETARGHAVTALGLLRANDTTALLRKMTTEGQRPALAREAAISLALIGDQEVRGRLAVLALKERLAAHRVSALLAMAYISDPSQLDPFVSILKDRRQNETVRAYAAVGIGLVADKDPIPWNHAIAADVGWWQAPTTLLDPTTGRGVLDLF